MSGDYFESRAAAIVAATGRGWERVFPGALSTFGTYFEDADGRIMSLRLSLLRESKPYYFAPADA